MSGAAKQSRRDPTLREMRATLSRLHGEATNQGRDTDVGKMFVRAYEHMAWLLDAFLFDTDDWLDDGGRA